MEVGADFGSIVSPIVGQELEGGREEEVASESTVGSRLGQLGRSRRVQRSIGKHIRQDERERDGQI